MAWSKLSRHERGYGKEWDKVRKVVMERDGGICQVCLKASRFGIIAQAVDHIVSKAKCAAQRWSQARTDHPNNLQAICRSCHDIKTENEQGKKKRKRTVPGPDGWPIG